MKRVIIYTISVCFSLASCTKQSSCKESSNYSEGILVVYEKPSMICSARCWGRFFPDSLGGSSGIGIFGSIPNKYKKMDTIRVGIELYCPQQTCITIDATPCKIKCIERIN